jgi:hydrogenase maturation protein HypF
MDYMAERAQIIVKGTVQGVGFRPYVFRLAESLHLKGFVTNTSEGVFIDVEGSRLPEFLLRLFREAPPLSRISDVSITNLPVQGYRDFSIQHSLDQAEGLPFTLVSPDVSVCDDCLKELIDPRDRRYLYPFINCTNCGPRYSITRSVPYDRPNTTMSSFTMCTDCQKEYEDPRNRRFHAQPNACPACGPAAEFRVRSAECGTGNEGAITEAIQLLQRGGIIAVKGLGGFHIACDALNDEAVGRLREKKRKSNKPFAVMAPTIDAAEQFSVIAETEKNILRSSRRPVVLLAKRPGNLLPEAVSPGNRNLGVMLPYTPLHYLLFYHPLDEQPIRTQPHFTALVMTSGNLSEEPIVRDNDEAIRKLSQLADGFLLHNRDIFMRVDDSVIRVRSEECGVRSEEKSHDGTANTAIAFLRRSRSYAPDPISLAEEGPEVLGCGADLKNTFTITKGKFAIPGQHIGDMENYETIAFFEESLANLKAVYRSDPRILVHDLHPGYSSTKWAKERGAGCMGHGVTLYGIQHHYAHIGSVMAEHGLTEKVIGVAFDGTGYGTDGNLWGGEFLVADIGGFERVGQIKYIPLPGGEAAIREPWRTAVSMVIGAGRERTRDSLDMTGFVQRYGKAALEQVITVAQSIELSPLASGAGRVFDAVSALLGICDRNTFEGEAAMALEASTVEGVEEAYPVELEGENGYTVVNFASSIRSIIADIAQPVPREIVATKFHNTVISAIRTIVRDISTRYGIKDVALSGGTFQNLYLLDRTARLLASEGLNIFINQKVPCNDGGISLGQAYLVRERLKSEGGIRNAPCTRALHS